MQHRTQELPMNFSMPASPALANTSEIVPRVWWGHLLWIAAAAALGFALASVFSGWLRMPRSLFLIPYVTLAGLFVYAYRQWSGVSVVELLRHHWLWGVLGAVLAGAFLVRNVLSQPLSPHTTGLALVWDLFWSGVVYGGIDALLLSVLPVLATWQAFSALGWTATWPGKLIVGVMALLLSLLVTVSYHLGFAEYRQPGGIAGPTIGNGVMSLGYLLTNNPLTAVFSHIAMHVAGVLHGPVFVMQLPPHY
jgi:hypothetical protein